MHSPAWFLSHSSRTRYVTGALAYFAQGIPMGLLHIALPAWLATQDVSAKKIATFLAIITLPWAFKLLTGPLMDHFEFLPMGKRRPWVIGAQFGMVISLLALMWLDDPVSQLGLLTAISFMINAFTATQDVAVDGMAIDMVPLEEEGRLNAFMSFGKAVGWALTSAITGTLLVLYGMQVTALVCGLGAAAIFIFLIAIRERRGERMFPWSEGEASPKNEPPPSFRAVFSDLNHILWTRASLIIMAIMFIDGLVSGYGRALMPIAAVKVFDFSTAQWADLNARSFWRKKVDGADDIPDRRSRFPAGGLAGVMGEQRLCHVHDVRLDPFNTGRDGLRPGFGHEYLFPWRISHAVRDLHVCLESGGIDWLNVLRHGGRAYQLGSELRPDGFSDLHPDVSHPYVPLARSPGRIIGRRTVGAPEADCDHQIDYNAQQSDFRAKQPGVLYAQGAGFFPKTKQGISQPVPYSVANAGHDDRSGGQP